MALSIIGVGLSRTGTLSLKRAIEELGRGPCYHLLDASAESRHHIEHALSTHPIDWDLVFRGYRAVVDAPAWLFYREIAAKYPTAKVVLTVREPNAWYNSIKVLDELFWCHVPMHLRTRFEQGQERVRAGEYGSILAQIAQSSDRDSRVAAFEQYNLEVQRLIPADRLLVFDVMQGWEPLCEFLGVPIPETPFPRANSSKELPSLLDRMWNEQSDEPHGRQQ